MAEQAKVGSLDALEFFRASLIVFLTKARQSLDEVRDEVRRLRQWLESDQQLYWEGQIRTGRRKLDQATQELFSARLSKFTDATPRQMAVRKARAALEHAEDRLRRTKKWNQNFDAAADPLIKRLESLRAFLDDEMPKAVTFLVQAQHTLEAYAEVPMNLGQGAPAASPEPEAQP